MRFVRKPKNKKTSGRYTSPYPVNFSRTGQPTNLKREKSTDAQKNWAEGTILYGEDDALPLRIAKSVQESPATSACLKTISQYIKGSGFSDKNLMKVKINKYGLTLWDLHSQLSDIIPIFEGFAINFKYSANQKITNSYIIPFESCRFEKPKDEQDDNIHCILYNPYFGTNEYDKKYTTKYHVYDPAKIANQVKVEGNTYKGQLYYFGKTKPLYRFYPVPDYWSAKKWIEIDGKIQEFHAENLDNGFFQSVLMNVVGDPNEWSRNPKTMTSQLKADGVTKIEVPTKTIGEEFNEMMADSFSGSKKAGNVMVLWANNKESATSISAFPTNTNADLFNALQDLCTKNITIATGVPGILANISEGVNLGSGGSEIQKAVELMQSRVIEWQNLLMQFYNEVLIPNLEVLPDRPAVSGQVKIVNFTPVSEPADIDEKFWEVLTPEEKRAFIRSNFPNVTLIETAPAAPAPGLTPTSPGQSAAAEPEVKVNENLKNLTGKQLQSIQRIVRKFNKGEITYEQAKLMLMLGYAMTQSDADVWLVTQEEEDDTNTNPIVSQ